jgi:signal transduction histidine kinase
VSSVHEKAGRVVFVVVRDAARSTDAAAQNRVATLGSFANHAALIVANALLHEEREIALAREVDLNRQKSDFVAAVSHELRTPLAVMLGSVHTLERLDGRMSDAQRAQLFDMTVDQGGRLQRLIEELLLVAAAEHSDVPLETTAVDVGTLFKTIDAATASLTRGRVITSAHTGCEIVTDQSKLERILSNLVENAAKYAPDGAIELRAIPAGHDLQFQVVDHGPGIPSAEAERVFERFVQLDQSSTRRQGGTGLGLHLCRQLAELIDGRLALSATPGGGCTFTLTIPAAADLAPGPNAPAPGSNVRVRPAEFFLPARCEPAR